MATSETIRPPGSGTFYTMTPHSTFIMRSHGQIPASGPHYAAPNHEDLPANPIEDSMEKRWHFTGTQDQKVRIGRLKTTLRCIRESGDRPIKVDVLLVDPTDWEDGKQVTSGYVSTYWGWSHLSGWWVHHVEGSLISSANLTLKPTETP